MKLRRSKTQIVYWLLGRRKRFQVSGASMQPTLSNGDTVLVSPFAYLHALPQVGDLVVIQHPERKLPMIKRVHHIEGADKVYVRGDNSEVSTDSRHFGWVSPESIIGKVVSLFS